MDFYQITEKLVKGEEKGSTKLELHPNFVITRSKDIMIRGRSFYAIWDSAKGLWSTDESDVQRLMDEELDEYRRKRKETFDGQITTKRLSSFESRVWTNYRTYLNQMFDNYHQLDEVPVFSNTKIKKSDYASRVLPYPLEPGNFDAYEEMISTLYDPSERTKLEWAIGAIISGDSKNIQKFIVLYGEAGSGKSTFLNIVEKLFDGYYTTFEAKALASNNNGFSMEVFKDNPLVAIQHDGDLSKIEDNTKLNSIISHEHMTMNEKYKSGYTTRINCFLFMGTNRPVKITDAKSGIIRRLIDVRPSLRKVPTKRYHVLESQIDFELSGIAYHCLEVYRSLGKNYYSSYRPVEMMFQTDVFFNFVEDNYAMFKEQDGVSLKQAYSAYKTYCEESLVEYRMPLYKFREELKSYFDSFSPITRLDGKQIRSYYQGFLFYKFNKSESVEEETPPYSLTLDYEESILDDILANSPAQYSNEFETPEKKWAEVTTTLSNLDSRNTHYVKVPSDHIVIDFDLKDSSGNKSFELNLEAASQWPATYAELSKSGLGIHLHYLYSGDITKLSRVYSDGIEVKVFTGNSALRRKLTKCNNLPIFTLKSGLPLKEARSMVNKESVKSEQKIRDLILRNLNKEFHPGTKPSIDFIHKILEDAYNSGLSYDVTDMRPKILVFANNSSNQSDYCIKLVNKMQFASEETKASVEEYDDDTIIFFDVEVFPNLFVVVWKAQGEGKTVVKLINPTAAEIEELLKFKLVGFNCRRYDNHILYARYIGYNNEALYTLSQRIIGDSRNCFFGEAYNLSYADVLDFSSKKQSLKKFQLELGIHHRELGLPWDQPVPEDRWIEVADYCVNDVVSLEAVFNDRYQDFVARKILSDLSGLTVNDTTQTHTAKIIFGDVKHPQDKFIYTDLREMFSGYVYAGGKSTYRGEETGEGGYVYAEPGMYTNVAVLDIASMHPTSLVCMDMFGPYTKNFEDLLKARIAIKHKDYETVKNTLDGILAKYVTGDDASLKDLAYSLKIVINSVYGYTSASFDNKFKDPRNKDNIVAKRGALFMVDLKHAVQEKGFTVAHIKTDSIKIPNATPEIIDFVREFGATYGYTFEHEGTYSKMCLVNDAVYIAKYTEDTAPIHRETGKKVRWAVTGKQFLVPYVFKKICRESIYQTTSGIVDLGGVDIRFEDLCEDKTVTSALYLDMNEAIDEEIRNDAVYYEKILSIRKVIDDPGYIDTDKYSLGDLNSVNALKHVPDEELISRINSGHNYHFVGKAGKFCPIKPGCGGGILLREKDGKYSAATGSKGYRWLESELVAELGKQADIDTEYYRGLVDSAISNISKFGDFEWFVDDVDLPVSFADTPPWCPIEDSDPGFIACSKCRACDQHNSCNSHVTENSTHSCSSCPNDADCNELPF